MSDTNAKTRGAHHVGLTVPDLSAARDFFIDALGFAQVGEIPDYPAVFVSDGAIMITLWQAEDPATAVPFDRHKNLGLHHLALRAENLERLAAELGDRHDVDIEFSPEPLGDTGIRHMMCRIPGNLAMDPRAGLLFVDFDRGNVLQVTGKASIDWDSAVIANYAGAQRTSCWRRNPESTLFMEQNECRSHCRRSPV